MPSSATPAGPPHRAPLQRLLLRSLVLLLPPLITACGVGCAGWTPWTSRERALKNAELYGPTANQRIKKIEEDAKQARSADGTRQVEFTRGLAETMLAEHDARVRCEIVAAAADFDTASALAICRGGLQDPDDRVRLRACEVWKQRGGEEAVQLLATRYRTDRDLDVRLRAVKMLGELKDQQAIPVLAEALENPDPAVQYRAVAALKEVSGRDLGNDVNAWRDWAADPSRAQPWSIAETFRKLF